MIYYNFGPITNTSLFIISIIESLILLQYIIKHFKLKYSTLIILILLMSVVKVFIPSVYNVFILGTLIIIYLQKILKIQSLYVIMVSILSIAIYICAYSIEKLFTPYFVYEYPERIEIVIIQIILLYFIDKVDELKEQFTQTTIINFSMMFTLITFMSIVVLKLWMKQPISQFEIITFLISIVIFSFLTIQYVFLLDRVIHSNHDLTQDLENNKYKLLTRVDVSNMYERNKKMSHNMKYTLLSLQYYLSKGDIEGGKKFINEHLKEVNTNKVCYTNNPRFDVLMKKFEERAKNSEIKYLKNIRINEQTYIDDLKNIEIIEEYLNNQFDYLEKMELKYISVSIVENSDNITFKSYSDYNEDELPMYCYPYSFGEGLVVCSLILRK